MADVMMIRDTSPPADVVDLPDGGAEVDLSPAQPRAAAPVVEHFDNLVDALDTSERYKLSRRMLELVESDLSDRADWELQIKRAMQLLALADDPDAGGSVDDDGSFESKAEHTLLLEAHTTFLAHALEETRPVNGPAEAQAFESLSDDVNEGAPGEAPELSDVEIDAARTRVRVWANWYFLTNLRDWNADHAQVISDCGLAGLGVKKVVAIPNDPVTPVVSVRVPVEDIILGPRGRLTHRMYYSGAELLRLMDLGVYAPVSLHGREGVDTPGAIAEERENISGVRDSESEYDELDLDATHMLYEIHISLRLEADAHPRGLPRPYAVTIHEGSEEVLAVRRLWDPEDPSERREASFVFYRYLPGFNSRYPMGLGQMLRNPAGALRSMLRAGITAADLANHPVGIMMGAWGAAMRDNAKKLRPGEWLTVDMPAGNGGTAPFQLFPFKGADPTLMALMDRVEGKTDRLAGTVTMNIAENSGPNQAVGTALAAYDAATTIPRAVHSNLYEAITEELAIFQRLARRVYAENEVKYDPRRKGRLAPGDLEIIELCPAMSPGSVSRIRRVAEAQTIQDMEAKYPAHHDQRAVVERVYSSLTVTDYDELLKKPEDVVTSDPISEFNAVMLGKALSAGWMQHHDAHIAAHAAAVQMLMSPGAEAMQGPAARAVPALQAHVADHVGRKLHLAVAQATGIPVEELAKGLPPELEMQLAPLMAKAMEAIAASMSGTGEKPLAIQLAELDQATKTTIEKMRTDREMAKVRIKDQGDTARNDADNRTATFIAGMDVHGKLASRPVPATDKNPRPPSAAPRSRGLGR